MIIKLIVFYRAEKLSPYSPDSKKRTKKRNFSNPKNAPYKPA